jgi:carbon monoxide dehydrogenase subunit G
VAVGWPTTLNLTRSRADVDAMASFETVIDVAATPEDAFAYVADYTNAVAWDPSIVSAQRLDDGPIREGSQFRVVVAFFGRHIELTYTIERHAPPTEVVLVGTGKSVESRVTIVVKTAGDGSRVDYRARLRLKGAMRMLDKGLQLPFTSMGERAAAGLATQLGADA